MGSTFTNIQDGDTENIHNLSPYVIPIMLCMWYGFPWQGICVDHGKHALDCIHPSPMDFPPSDGTLTCTHPKRQDWNMIGTTNPFPRVAHFEQIDKGDYASTRTHRPKHTPPSPNHWIIWPQMEAPCAKHTCVAHWMKHIMELPSPLRQRWGVDCKLGTQTTWENDSEQNPAYWIISKRKPSVTIWKVAKTMGLYVHTKIANLMWQVCPSCTKSDKAYKMQKFFIAYTMHNSMTKPKKSINSYFDLMHNNMTP